MEDFPSSRNLTNAQLEAREERRLALVKKIQTLRELQHIYSPASPALEFGGNPEKEPLGLPSGLPTETRRIGCKAELFDMEAKLRQAQCEDYLVTLRSLIHLRSHHIYNRNENVTGQHSLTCSQSTLDTVTKKITRAANGYRLSHTALLALIGDQCPSHLRQLKDENLTSDSTRDSDYYAHVRLSRAGAERGPQTKRLEPQGSAKRVLSWIWTANTGEDDGAEVHECKYKQLWYEMFN